MEKEISTKVLIYLNQLHFSGHTFLGMEINLKIDVCSYKYIVFNELPWIPAFFTDLFGIKPQFINVSIL